MLCAICVELASLLQMARPLETRHAALRQTHDQRRRPAMARMLLAAAMPDRSPGASPLVVPTRHTARDTPGRMAPPAAIKFRSHCLLFYHVNRADVIDRMDDDVRA